MNLPYYFDHNASTAVDEKVLESMLPFFRQNFGNASSASHPYGWIAAKAVEMAREKIAELLNAEANEIIFTSGSTEAINIGLKGLYHQYKKERNIIVSFETEHKAVIETLKHLALQGAIIKWLKVDRFGLPDLEEIKNVLTEKVLCISVPFANSETGVVFPVKEIAQMAHENACFVFSDLTQTPGKIVIDVNDAGIDLACLSAHKMYGPKGVGALFTRRKNPRVQLEPSIFGGGQEKSLRPGTLNVSGIAGMGAAAELAKKNVWEWGAHVSKIRTWFEQQIIDEGYGFLNGSTRHRLPNTSNICFDGLNAVDLMKKLSFMAISSGSACSSEIPEPSPVLLAMGLSKEQALASLRFSFGKDNTFEQVQEAAQRTKIILSEMTGKK